MKHSWVFIFIFGVMSIHGESIHGEAGSPYFVNPRHPNASSGDNYFSEVRGYTDVDLIAQGYGTMQKPFGSILEAVYQIRVNGEPSTNYTTIYVAPGIYRQNVYMPTDRMLHLIADSKAEHIDPNYPLPPGDVIVTGSEPVNTPQLVLLSGYTNVYAWFNARLTNGESICYSEEERFGDPCVIEALYETLNPKQYESSYVNVGSIDQVALTPGSYYYAVSYTAFSGGNQAVVDLYFQPFNFADPVNQLGVEYVFDQQVGSYTSDIFYKHRHAFDMEGGGYSNIIEGFVCRYTSSYPIHSANANVIRNNIIYGGDNAGIQLSYSGTNNYGDYHIENNIISHIRGSGTGIQVINIGSDVYLENNIVHHAPNVGIFLNTYPSSAVIRTVSLMNNTIYGNNNGFVAGQGSSTPAYSSLVAFNNTSSSNNFYDFAIRGLKGSTNVSHNHSFGSQLGVMNFPDADLMTAAPQFEDAEHNNFALKTTSPLINRGISEWASLPAPSSDYVSRSRPQDKNMDIGAFEKPANLYVTPINSDQLLFNWNSSSGVYYQVQYATSLVSQAKWIPLATNIVNDSNMISILIGNFNAYPTPIYFRYADMNTNN